MQVTEHIHALRIPFQVPAPDGPVERFVIVYLVVGETVWLIDAGVAGAEEMIAGYLGSLGRDLSDIDTLVLTHSHPDHVGAARAVWERTGCSVAAHPAERAWIEDVQLQARERPLPGFDRLVGGSVPVQHLLQDGARLTVGEGLTFDVIHTPGHSRGSISLYLPEEGALFTGDAVPLPGNMPIFDSAGDSVASLRRLSAVQPVRVLLSAWDVPRWGEAATTCLDEGLAWLNRVQQAVCSVRSARETTDPLAFCRSVLEILDMPPEMANPLVARTFAGIA